MPDGDDVTVPLPVPALVTVSACVVAVVLKVAVTDRAAVIATVHAAVPVQAPLQPAKVEPLAAEAVSVTEAVLAKLALQVAPQLMPAGDDVTVPVPAPALVTVRVWFVPPVRTNGERKFPGMTACAMPGPCQATATLSPPPASLCRTSM
jgi:hypothetical protein